MKPRELEQVPQGMEQSRVKAGAQFQVPSLVSTWNLETETDHASLIRQKIPHGPSGHICDHTKGLYLPSFEHVW